MNTCINIIRTLSLLLLIGLVVGCGGSGSASSNITPKITIEWPTITREVKAPPYAGSAEITLTVGSASTPSHWFVDRPAGDTGQTIAYPSPDSGKAGPALLQIRFFSKAGAAGTEVATAAVSAKIDSDGNLLNSTGGPLGTITYSSTITGFFVNRLKIGVDEAQPFVVTGFANSVLVALPQSIVNLQIITNPENASISNGILTGIHEGPFVIQVSFEAVTAPVAMNVTPKIATFNKVAFPANHIAWDPIHGRFWGTFGFGTPYANAIVDINPLTGIIGTPIPVGSMPNQISVSSDGSTAYVGLDGGSAVRMINLNSRMAGATTSLQINNAPVTVTSLDVNPGNPNEFAVCTHDVGDSGFNGPLVFRDGTQVGDTPGVYTASNIKYTSASSLIGVQEGISSGSVYDIGITATTVDFLRTLDTNSFVQGDWSIYGSTAILGNGLVIDLAGLTVSGHLNPGPEVGSAVATDDSNALVWSATQDSQNDTTFHVRAYDLSTFIQSSAVDLPSIAPNESLIQVNRFGNTGLAVLSNKSLYILPSAPGL